jgi:hypothetical protein
MLVDKSNAAEVKRQAWRRSNGDMLLAAERAPAEGSVE